MLQYPINVYPDKVALDASKSTYDRDVHFTFKGDLLTCVYWRLYNYDTQQIVAASDFCDPNLAPIAYNNDTVTGQGILANRSNGKYILQMMLTQTQKNLTGGLYNVYDRYVSRGKIAADYTSGSLTIKIENKSNLIYEWNKSGNVCSQTTKTYTPSGGSPLTVATSAILMEVGGTTTVIDDYNYETGECNLDTGISQNIAAGTDYKLYANYLITEQYYFEIATEPTIEAYSHEGASDIWVTWKARDNDFAAFYWQGQQVSVQQGTMLKYYQIKLQKKRNTTVYDDIFETEKIYSQNIDWHFVDDYDPAELHGGNYETREYKIILTCVMQNGMSFTKEYEVQAPERNSTETFDSLGVYFSGDDTIFNHTQLRWNRTEAAPTNLGYRIYRMNASGLYNTGTKQDKLDIAYANYPHKTLIGITETPNNNEFTDRFPSNHGNYQYMVVPYVDTNDGTTIYKPYVTNPVDHDFDGYTIAAIKDTGKDVANKKIYLMGDVWKIMCDIDDTDNVQNFNRVLHVGNGKYSTATSVENDYLSGSLGGYIGNMSCSRKQFEDDIEVVKAWRRFLAQDCQFVLRTNKGDVLLVNLIDNGTTKYEEDNVRVPVQFSISWAECGSMEDILVFDRMPNNYTDRR